MAAQIQQYVKTVLVFIFSAFFFFACSNGGGNGGFSEFSDRQSEFFSADVGNARGNWLMDEDAVGAGAPAPEAQDSAVREIEEADIVEIDGTNLYILNAYRGLAVCDVSSPDNPSITGRCPISGEPIEMYIRNGKAYVIVSVPQAVLYAEQGATELIEPFSFDTLSRIEVIDVANPSNPRIVDTLDLEGRVTDSRIVGDILYAVSSETEIFFLDVRDETGTSTATSDDVEAAASNGSNVYVASIDLSDSGNIVEVDRVDFGGSARHIHVTETAIFIAADPLDYGTNRMDITYVDISDPAGTIRKRGEFEVQGTIQDEFKMDYDEGYFRVCTHQWDSKTRGLSRLYVFDVTDPDAAVEVGSLELGEGEQLFATRFDGDRAYMVTFEQIDPLWVIDLSDPANPEIKGELEVPGWSTHIQAMGDHLVALGIDDTEGQWRVSVSLFDVTDPGEPTLTDRVSFGEGEGWSWSTASYDVKAFTVLEEMGLILLPYSTASYGDGPYRMENRLQLIDYAPDDLTPRGWVSQKGSVLRGRSFSDRLFSVSTEELQVIDASDRDNPRVSADLTLAENVVDFIPLENGYGVKVTESGGEYALQAVDVDSLEDIISETVLDDFSYTSHFVNGDLVYLVESRYGGWLYMDEVGGEEGVDAYEHMTTVTVFDFTAPGAPVQRGTIDIEGYYSSPVFLDESFVRYPYSYGQEIVQVQDDLLTFVALNPWDDTDEEVSIVDFSDPDAPNLAARHPVEENNATGFFAGSGVLYYSYTVEAEEDEEGRSQIQYYLGRIDLADPADPESLPGINIPGICLGMDETGIYAYTIDNQWLPDAESDVEYTFNAVRIEDDTAYLMGEAILPEYYNSFLIADGLAYIGGYSWWWYSDGGMIIIDLADPENLEQYDTGLPQYVTSILGAKNRTAFFSMWNGIGCYDVQDPGSPELTEYKYGYTYNSRVAFSGGKAYLPMGYYGLWVKEM
jgi:uncharacterized secreted protein with C-terminal beta-propeller domain